VNLEAHGREEILPRVDLSRTVGWFTALYPVLLEVDRTGSLGGTLQSVKEELRRIPRGGTGYGLLRYLSNHPEAATLRSSPQPEVSFNYLGHFSPIEGDSAAFHPARESAGRTRSGRGKRLHRLEVSGRVSGGKLRMDWMYCTHMYREATIDSLAQSCLGTLQSILTHCLSSRETGVTPSDFPKTRLSTPGLERAFGQVGFEGSPSKESG
jgi:non-ribosomal peptide synthase protein (TIGR01720 family)